MLDVEGASTTIEQQTGLKRKLQSPLYMALILLLSARLAAIGLGWLLWQQGFIPEQPTSRDHIYLDVEPVSGPVSTWALGTWHRFDTSYYLQIATYGYGDEYGVVVFPPLYPLLIRLSGTILGGQYLAAGLLISSAACVGLLVVLYRIASEQFDPASARRTVVYQMVFPTAYILIAAYAEPLMLLLMLLAFRWAQRGRWWLAGAATFLATLTRLQAAILVLPLAYLYVKQWGISKRALRLEILSLAAAPAAVLGYNLYLAWRGLPSVQTEFVQYWYAAPSVPGTDLLKAIKGLILSGLGFRRGLQLALAILFLFLTGIALWRMPTEYGLYMIGIFLYSFANHDLAGRPLHSVARHMLVMFPGFMLLGAAGKRPWLNRLILYPSLGLYLFLMGVFFMWGYVE